MIIDTLNADTAKASNPLHIGLLLRPHFSLLSLSGFMEVFRYVGNIQKYSAKKTFKLSVISATSDEPIISHSGVTISPDSIYVSPEKYQYISIIGGNHEQIDHNTSVEREFIEAVHHANIPLIGIGSGSLLLAQQGLLNKRRVSIHPFHLDYFVQKFPQVYIEQGYDFIDEGNIITCPGGISTIKLAIELIRMHVGECVATNTYECLSMAPAERGPANLALILDLRLRSVVLMIDKYLTHPLTTARLAGRVKLSERQLNRLFLAEFGKTVQEFIRVARLRYACWLLKNSKESVTDIALRMRFCDCAHFIRHFQTEFGCTPGTWRKTNRTMNMSKPVL